MFRFKQFPFVPSALITLVFIFSIGCGRSGQLLGDLPVPDENKDIPKNETPVSVANNQFTCNPDQARDENNRVSIPNGCSPEKPGLVEARSAFDQGDFITANCKASLVFNESIGINPTHPNTEAAFIALWSRVFLEVESDDMAYFLLDDERKFKSTIFGPQGNTEEFAKAIESNYKTAIKDVNPLPPDVSNLYIFAKAHELHGHSVDQIIDRVKNFLNRVGPDFHVFAKAMAHDPHMEIPLNFPNPEMDDKQHVFNAPLASLLDFYLTSVITTGNLATHYHSGIKSAEAFTDDKLLVKELNQAPKAFSLRGSKDASEVIPLVSASLSAAIHASIQVYSPSFWAQDFNSLLPAPNKETPVSEVQAKSFRVISVLLELQQSLNDRMISITASEGSLVVNLAEALKNLPSTDDFGFDLFILGKDGGMDINSDLVQAYYNKEKAKYSYIEIKE
ncbi:MAG: hypothetical protein HYU97_07295 [Deltaproteobacteria bacterium]|nr:hypothetical protein [Deltaproteobacteria bacterium]